MLYVCALQLCARIIPFGNSATRSTASTSHYQRATASASRLATRRCPAARHPAARRSAAQRSAAQRSAAYAAQRRTFDPRIAHDRSTRGRGGGHSHCVSQAQAAPARLAQAAAARTLCLARKICLAQKICLACSDARRRLCMSVSCEQHLSIHVNAVN